MCEFIVKLFSSVNIFLFCFLFAALQGVPSQANSSDTEDVHAIAQNLFNLTSSEIPPLLLDLLRDLPIDVKDILKAGQLYELSKEQLATIPVPLLYLLPNHQLYNLSGYQHGMLLRSRPDILSLADLVVNSMQEPDVKDPFLKSLQYARNLSGPVQNEMGHSIAGWKSTEIEFEKMYATGDPLAVHMPLSFMLNMNSKLKSEMMFYLRTWLWEDHPYRGANIVKWLNHPWSIRRVFTKLCIEDNYPAPLHEWKYNHVEAFSHIIPTMTLAEFSQISLSERFNYKKLLSAPLNTLQIRYLFETMYPSDQLYYVEFQEFSHLLSSLQPQHLNKFYVNATDMIHAKYHLNNITYGTAKQIAEMIKVQTQWSAPENSPALHDKRELSNQGPLLYTWPAAELAQLDPSNVDMELLKLDGSKLSFPQVYELGHIKANLSLSTPSYLSLPQAMPAQTLQRIEPKNLAFEDLLNLLRWYPGTQEAFSATLMSRLRQNLSNRHLEAILLNPARNKLLKYLPVPETPSKLYTLLSQLYEQPMYRVLIDQLDSSLIRTIMPLQVSYKMYIKDRFLFKGMTCAHISNINTYELVVFTQDYFNYIKTNNMAASLTKQSMNCWFARLNNYVQMKPSLPLLREEGTPDGNRIDQLSQHELRAFGNVVILYTEDMILSSGRLETIVDMWGQMPREFLDNMKPRTGYDLVLRKYFEKTLNSSNTIGINELLSVGNLTHFIPGDLIVKVDTKAFKILVETQLVDSRLCGNFKLRRQMEELIVKAFGHVSTWTPDILVLLKDLLLALSEDQMHQIPTKSWTDMADLIVTSYAEDTLDEYGVARPFYKACMARLNETESQDYFQSLSGLINFYLVKIQLHMDTVKSAAEIISHQMHLATTADKQPVYFKPSAIDDDEMNTLLILEPESSEIEDPETSTETTTIEATTTTTEPTITEVITTEESTEPPGEIYKIDAHNITTNESEFNFWDVYAKPMERTTKLSVGKEAVTTTKTSGKSKNDSGENSSTEILDGSLEKSEEAFIAQISHHESSEQSNEIIRGLDDNVGIIGLEDSVTTEGRNNETKIPCGDGSCMANKAQDVTKPGVTEEKEGESEDTASTTVRDEKDKIYSTVREEDMNSQVVDQIIDVDEANGNTSSVTESSTIRYQTTTKQPQDTTTVKYDLTTTETEKDSENKVEINGEEVATKENSVGYEESSDVILNDLTKWNQHHDDNHEQNEIQVKANNRTPDFAEKVRHKKENRIENYLENTVLPNTTDEHNTGHENTTDHQDQQKLHELISNMPSVPSEDPSHEHHLETNVIKNNTDHNSFENDFIVKSEDREIMGRVHSESRETETENIMIEITDELNRIQETTTIHGTNNNDQSNKILTEPTDNKNENSIASGDNSNKEPITTTTTKYENQETTTNPGHKHRMSSESIENNSAEKEGPNRDYANNGENRIHKNSKESNGQFGESQNYSNNELEKTTKSPSKNQNPNRQNKLTDELTTTQTNSYESKENTKDNYNSKNRYNDEINSDELTTQTNSYESKENTKDNYNSKNRYNDENNSDELTTRTNSHESKDNYNSKNRYNDEINSDELTTRTNSHESKDNYNSKNRYNDEINSDELTTQTNSYESKENTKDNYNSKNRYNDENNNDELTTRTNSHESKDNYNSKNRYNDEINSDELTTRTNSHESKENTKDNYNSKNRYNDENNSDELTTTETNSYESKEKTKDNYNSKNEHKENENISPNQEEEARSYGSDGTGNNNTTSGKSMAEKTVEDTFHEKDPMLANNYPTDSHNEKSNEDNLEIPDQDKDQSKTSSSEDVKDNKSIDNILENERENSAEPITTTQKDIATTTTSRSLILKEKEEIKNTEEINTELTEEHTEYETTVPITVVTVGSSIVSRYRGNEPTTKESIIARVEVHSPIETTTLMKTIETTILSNHNEIETDNNENKTPEESSENINTNSLEEKTSTIELTQDKEKVTTSNNESSVGDEKRISEKFKEVKAAVEAVNNEPSPSIKTTESTQKQIQKTIEYEKYKLSNKVEDLNDNLEVQKTPESQNNTIEKYPGNVSTRLSLSEHPVISVEFTTAKLPGNYKPADFIPQTPILNSLLDKDMDVSDATNETAFRNLEQFVVYDVPDDGTPEDITQGDDSHGKDYKKSRSNELKPEETSTSDVIPKGIQVENATTLETLKRVTSNPNEDKSLTRMEKDISEVESSFKPYNLITDLDLVVLDVTDEPIDIDGQINRESNRRKRRFVINEDNRVNPSQMNIKCEALNILGTITQIANIENIIIKLNKDELLDCLDLINKMSLPRRATEFIINKYYRNINEVLPILGNVLADFSLEEIRSIHMNVWSLEIMGHMNSVNDSKKAELIVEKYLKSVNRTVLNVNEMAILNNMLCYLPENLLSTVNLKPTELLSILKHVSTCSAKCLSTFSSLAVQVLGTPMSWKYEQVYNLGTIPSGLNDTLWNEFIQQKHLKYNMNEKNYECFNESQLVSVNNAVIEESVKYINDDHEVLGTSEVQDEGYSSSSKNGPGYGLLVSLYLVVFCTKYFL